MARLKFLRRGWWKKLKLSRKKKLKWRAPKGRDNAMRLKRKSYQRVVSIGYKKPKDKQGKVKGLTPSLIKNLKELDKGGKLVIIAKIGERKRQQIIKKAEEKGIKVLNLKRKNKNETK